MPTYSSSTSNPATTSATSPTRRRGHGSTTPAAAARRFRSPGPTTTRARGPATSWCSIGSGCIPILAAKGLGPIVAAAVIERLGRGCHLAACYPAPFDDPTQHPDDRDRAIEALGKLWSKVGFTHWRDGVSMLDLDTSDRHAALAKLLAAT